MIRLEPMSEAEFQASLERAVGAYAQEWASRGAWEPASAVAASRAEFAQLLPLGRRTPERSFCKVVEDRDGSCIGETWYRVHEQGGQVQFYIEWIWIDPAHRRRGYASRLLLKLSAVAERAGAEQVGLSVVYDNEGAVALYTKLGFVPVRMRMVKPLTPARPPPTTAASRAT